MLTKKAKWVRLWCSGGRGYRRDHETYIRTADTSEDALRCDAEQFNDEHFVASEVHSRYGFMVVRKPPKEWLQKELRVTRSKIELQIAHARMIESELGMLPTKADVEGART